MMESACLTYTSCGYLKQLGNALWDYVSGGALEVERQVVRQIATLVGWSSNPGGAFTFGGKACLSYAIKCGLNRLGRSSVTEGLQSLSYQPVVISSAANHYSIEYVCSLLGIGTASSIRTKVTDNDEICLDDLRKAVRETTKSNQRIACVVISGGNTLNMAVDDILEVVSCVTEEIQYAGLTYRPFFYVDLVVGWPWLFFRKPEIFSRIADTVRPETVERLSYISEKLENTNIADAIGIDFHKFGFCAYQSSLFVTNDSEELTSINREELRGDPWRPHGGNFVQHHTLEHSRSAAPIFAAWSALQTIGIGGYAQAVADGVDFATEFRLALNGDLFGVANRNGCGPATVFYFKNSTLDYGMSEQLNDQGKWSSEEVQAHNADQFAFSVFLEEKGYMFRYLPNFMCTAQGHDIAGVVCFPMSPHTNSALGSEIASKLNDFAWEFIRIGMKESVDGSTAPKHVPK